MKKLFLGIFFFLANTYFVFSQTQPTSEIGNSSVFSAAATYTGIHNDNIDGDKNKLIINQPGYSCAYIKNLRVMNKVAIGIGCSVSNYRNTIYQKGLFIQNSQIDKDGYMYNLWVNSDMTYKNKLTCLELPINLHLILLGTNKVSVVGEFGCISNFTIMGIYSENGSIATMSNYSLSPPNQYFTYISQNNSYYNNQKINYDKIDSDKFRKFTLAGRIAVGIVSKIGDFNSISICPYYVFGLNDLNTTSAAKNNYFDVFGQKTDYKPSKLFSYGISIGVTIDSRRHVLISN